tara:strand:- start:69 stop:311 length:243 start_codon:yes stop_codon:yes gene_type:complete
MNDVNSQNDDIYSKYTKEFLDHKVEVLSIVQNKDIAMSIKDIVSGLDVPTECSAHLYHKNNLQYALNKAIREYPTPFKNQ